MLLSNSLKHVRQHHMECQGELQSSAEVLQSNIYTVLHRDIKDLDRRTMVDIGP